MRANHGNVWTFEEKQILKEQYGSVDIMTLVQKLKRSENAINRMAYSLGLGAIDNSEFICAQHVAEMFGLKNHTSIIRGWVGKHGLKAKRIGYKKDSKRKFVMIAQNDLMEWMEHNQDKYSTVHLELNILGDEPKWLKEKRKLDSKNTYSRNWPAEDTARLISYYRRGMNYKQIAEKLNRSPGACRRKVDRTYWGKK